MSELQMFFTILSIIIAAQFNRELGHFGMSCLIGSFWIFVLGPLSPICLIYGAAVILNSLIGFNKDWR